MNEKKNYEILYHKKCFNNSKRAKGKKNYKFNLAGQKNGTKILEK